VSPAPRSKGAFLVFHAFLWEKGVIFKNNLYLGRAIVKKKFFTV
jgi:hypothetical protein